jgi:hypothetical protein
VRRSRVGPSYNRESLYGLADLVWRALYFHRCSTPWNRRISARNQGELQNRSNQNSRSFAVKISQNRSKSAKSRSISFKLGQIKVIHGQNQSKSVKIGQIKVIVIQTRSNQGHTRSKSYIGSVNSAFQSSIVDNAVNAHNERSLLQMSIMHG